MFCPARRFQAPSAVSLPARRTGWAWLLALATLASCGGADGLVRKTGPEYESETRSWLESVRVLSGHGYWLVTRGYHRGDDAVAMATNQRWSHASIVDLENLEVIEAVGQGVIQTPLFRFLREAHRVRIIRPKGWTPDKGREAVARARSKVGSSYDFLGVVGAPSDQRFYCSELAAWSMGLEVDRKGASHVLHPASMHELGDLLWEAGPRDGKPDLPDQKTVARARVLREPVAPARAGPPPT